MIILAPTGLYKTLLPRDTKSGAVTWTISNNEPPVSNYRILQVPVIPRIQVPSLSGNRRNLLGARAFTLLSNERKEAGSAKKLFEIGEIIEFSDETPTEVTTVRMPDKYVLQHNTNRLDFTSVGLTKSEVDTITQDAGDKMEVLTKRLNDALSEIKDIRVKISEVQKSINETNKTMNGIANIYDIDVSSSMSGNEIYDRLQDSLDALEAEQTQLISDLEAKIIESQQTYDQLTRVSQLSR